MGILLLIIFFVFIIIVSINSIVEFIIELSHRIKYNARAKYIKKHFPEAYDEYFSGDRKYRINRREDSFSEFYNWSNQQWEEENSKLIVKKNRKLRWENDIKWEEEQFDFAKKCLEIAKKAMPGFGYYFYSPKVSAITEDGLPSNLEMRVRQFFPMSLCLDEQLDYTNTKYIKNNLNNLQEFKDKKKQFAKDVYDKIIAFIKELSKEDDVLICLNQYIKGWDGHALQFHYKNIIEGIDASHVITLATNSYVGFEVKEWGKRLKKKLIIIDMMTENDSLEWKCAQIFETLREKHPLICYISLLKCFSREEMIEIINEANAEAKKKADKERVKEEERAKLKDEAHTIFKNNIKKWEMLTNDFYYTWLFYYYPTKCEFEANKEEWANRYTVWDFKNDPDRDISLIDHVNALDKVIPQIKKKLTDTFGEKYLQFISLVCIPASTKERNEFRYDTFSRRLCKLTGMENAFKHITITEDGMAKNDKKNTTGHSKQPKIRIDDWFKGKYVLLFDDVITKGNTMLRYKRLLEDAGATVIGGLTLGKTKHERIP